MDSGMDKDHILENDVIGRYVAGELDDEEVEAFEFAYFHDDELAALVEAEQALQRQFGRDRKADDTVSWTRWSIAAAVILASAPALYFATREATVPYVLSSSVPETSTPAFELVSERGAAPSLAIPIPDQPDDRIVLAIPVASSAGADVRLVLRNNVPNVIWQETHAPAEKLYLSVAAFELVQGEYELTVEMVSGSTVSIDGAYRFRTYEPELGLPPEQ